RARLRDGPKPASRVESDALDAAGHRIASLYLAREDVERFERSPGDFAARDPERSGRCDGSALRVAWDDLAGRCHLLAQDRPVRQRFQRSHIKFERAARSVLLVTADPNLTLPRSGESALEPRPERKSAEGGRRRGKCALQLDLE